MCILRKLGFRALLFSVSLEPQFHAIGKEDAIVEMSRYGLSMNLHLHMVHCMDQSFLTSAYGCKGQNCPHLRDTGIVKIQINF